MAQNLSGEAFKRELVRRSQDRIKVYNPTDTDFVVLWDRFRHVVPAKTRDRGYGPGIAVFPRYIAMRYFQKMTDYLITNDANEAIKKENEHRLATGQKKMDGWEEQPAFEVNYSTGDPTKRAQYIAILYQGIEEEYGLDEALAPEDNEKRDARPLDERILESLGLTESGPSYAAEDEQDVAAESTVEVVSRKDPVNVDDVIVNKVLPKIDPKTVAKNKSEAAADAKD